MTRRSRSRKTATRRKSTPRFSRTTVLLLIGLLIVLYLYETGKLDQWLGGIEVPTTQPQPPSNPQPQPPVAGNGEITPYFTTVDLVYPDRAAQRGDSQLLDAVLADINAAKTSVLLASFDFDLVPVADALLSAHERGLDVRLVVDSENLETAEVAEETGRLQDAGIGVIFDDREPFMHNKFLVLDDAIAWTGSWNVTVNDTYRNNNNFIRIANGEIAANYRHEFDKMFGGTFGTKKASDVVNPSVQIGSATVETFFSPEDGIAKFVTARLEAATQRIRFMAFSYTSDEIAQQMIQARQRGLEVDGVFESQNANGTGSEFTTLVNGGVNVLEDGNCYILHHKTIIIDDRIVITGSYNFTASAERSNDENLVIIDDPAIAAAYNQEFDRVFAQAQQPTRCGS